MLAAQTCLSEFDSGTHGRMEGGHSLHKLVLWPLRLHHGMGGLVHTWLCVGGSEANFQ